MQFLIMQIGTERYALSIHQVAEVLPLLSLKKIPCAQAGVAGVLNYRGTPVPVIDLSVLMLNRPSAEKLSTRIVLVHYESQHGTPVLLGLIAERVTELAKFNLDEFTPAGISNHDTPYLGSVVVDEHGVVQWIEVNDLLPEAVRQILFQQVLEHALD